MDDFIGKRFGKLTVVKFDYKDKNRKKHYLCKCDCGNTASVCRNNLVSGTTKSCGCIKIKMLKDKSKEYSKRTNEKLYNTWSAMKQRCCNKNASNYYKYGKRGIKICDDWIDSFENFAKWSLSNGYKDGLSIDRINVNGNYEPSNCRWSTQEEQSLNKRNSITVIYKNERMTLIELSKRLNKSYSTIYGRYKKGEYQNGSKILL